MSLSAIFRLPVVAGLELIEARRSRLQPDASRIGYVDRCIINARNACRADLERRYTIVPNS